MRIDEYAQAMKGALLFRDEAFSLDMRKGFVILVCVGLVVGLAAAYENAVEKGKEFSQEEFERGMRQAFVGMQNVPPEVRENIEYYLGQMPVYVNLGKQTQKLISPVHPYLQFLGDLLSGPFGFCGFWMMYGSLVYLFAIWLGGTGSAQKTFAATSLWSVPHLLKIGGIVPWVGGLLSFIAWVWGILIYIKGISVSQGLDVGKSILVFLLPIAAFILLGVVGLLLFIAVVA